MSDLTAAAIFEMYRIDPSLVHRHDEMFAPMPYTLPIDICVLMDTHGTMDQDHYDAMHTYFADRNTVLTSIIKWRHNPDTWVSGSEWQAAKAYVRDELAAYQPKVFVVTGTRGYDVIGVEEGSWSNQWGGWFSRTGKLVLDGMGDKHWIGLAARYLEAGEEMVPRA